MPWSIRDAYSHTKKANTPKLQRQWATIANSALDGGADEASAIRQANAAVGKNSSRRPMKPKARSATTSNPGPETRTGVKKGPTY